MTPDQAAEEFLKVASEFNLGNLYTEQSHPETLNLSSLSQENISGAIRAIGKVDGHMIETLINKLPEIEKLSKAIKRCFLNDGRIFLCGCGATGRLSLVIETLWRQLHNNGPKENKIISFMAGGDVALISSIEKFEDFPEYGKKQLNELGFSKNDLFIGSTEGGETPFVIGATIEAQKISKISPYFLYCNPDTILMNLAQRTISVLKNDKITKLNLTHGAQALSGSTRMQASSIIMMSIALSLFEETFDKKLIKKQLCEFWDNYFGQVLKLADFIEMESAIYNNEQQLLYAPSQELAISVLTDTTERAPTFSLNSFENYNDDLMIKMKSSLCYLYFPESHSTQEAWNKLLYRKPRTLEWKDFENIACQSRLQGFQFCQKILKQREKLFGKKQNIFHINDVTIKNDGEHQNGVLFKLNSHQFIFKLTNTNHFYKHLFLKMLMNTMSTIIMGRLGRFRGNVMTWVKPSNNKLIDRTVRYALMILKEKNVNCSYRDLVILSFKLKENFDPKLSLVEQLVKHYS